MYNVSSEAVLANWQRCLVIQLQLLNDLILRHNILVISTATAYDAQFSFPLALFEKTIVDALH